MISAADFVFTYSSSRSLMLSCFCAMFRSMTMPFHVRMCHTRQSSPALCRVPQRSMQRLAVIAVITELRPARREHQVQVVKEMLSHHSDLTAIVCTCSFTPSACLSVGSGYPARINGSKTSGVLLIVLRKNIDTPML